MRRRIVVSREATASRLIGFCCVAVATAAAALATAAVVAEALK